MIEVVPTLEFFVGQVLVPLPLAACRFASIFVGSCGRWLRNGGTPDRLSGPNGAQDIEPRVVMYFIDWASVRRLRTMLVASPVFWLVVLCSQDVLRYCALSNWKETNTEIQGKQQRKTHSKGLGDSIRWHVATWIGIHPKPFYFYHQTKANNGDEIENGRNKLTSNPRRGWHCSHKHVIGLYLCLPRQRWS